MNEYILVIGTLYVCALVSKCIHVHIKMRFPWSQDQGQQVAHALVCFVLDTCWPGSYTVYVGCCSVPMAVQLATYKCPKKYIFCADAISYSHIALTRVTRFLGGVILYRHVYIMVIYLYCFLSTCYLWIYTCTCGSRFVHCIWRILCLVSTVCTIPC